jgi:trans-aconitate methyltransferase
MWFGRQFGSQVGGLARHRHHSLRAGACPRHGRAILAGMATMPWQEQIAYYRARAAEYDLTSYRDVHGADRRIAALVAHLQPSGELLEIACGTGMWTRHLAGCAATVTAIDAAPEMVALARQRVTAGNMTFLTADILTWAPPRRFDTIFFAFWLSHVPASMFGRFWSLLRTALTSSGRVLFVDDQPAAAGLEAYAAGSSEVAERRLRDGTRHRLIKVVRDPPDLTRQLTELGWHATITRSGDWLVGQARPLP